MIRMLLWAIQVKNNGKLTVEIKKDVLETRKRIKVCKAGSLSLTCPLIRIFPNKIEP